MPDRARCQSNATQFESRQTMEEVFGIDEELVDAKSRDDPFRRRNRIRFVNDVHAISVHSCCLSY